MAETKKVYGSIFDKLTDPSQYPKTHQARFDANGKGLGKAGRETAAHSPNGGYRSSSPGVYQKVRVGSPGPAGALRGKTAAPKTAGGPAVASDHAAGYKSSAIFDRLTDPNLYPATHRARFGPDGKGLGLEGRKDEGPTYGFGVGERLDAYTVSKSRVVY